MHRQNLFGYFWFIIILCELAVAQNSASTPPQSGSIIKANTRLVIVDVVATDSKNQPVTDLEAKDFTVLENGNEQRINSFTFQNPAGTQNNEAPAQPFHSKNPASNTFTNVPVHPPDATLTVILLDGLNTATLNQTQAR